MSEKAIIQHLHESRLGVSSYDRPLPAAPVYLAPDVRCPGRFETLDGESLGRFQPNADMRQEVVWFGSKPTSASRPIARRTMSYFRVRETDPADNRVKVAESITEASFFRIKRAENRNGRIFDQPPAREYVHPDGSVLSHTFDFLVEELDGSWVAYAVRPHERVDEKLETAVRCIREQSLSGFADAAMIVTDRHITKARLHNADEILDAREYRNDADVELAAEYVRSIRGGVMLGRLVAALGLGPRGRTALICLVDDGVLEFVSRERLTATTLLRPRLPRVALTEGDRS